MNPLLYASITRQTLSEEIDGGGYDWPDLVAGGSIHLGLRTTTRRDAVNTLIGLDIVDAYAAVGSLDARPASGTTRLKLGTATSTVGTNVTTELTVANLTAAGLVAAFTALSAVGEGDTYPVPTAVDSSGTILLTFPGATEPVPIALVDNELLPISLLRVVNYTAGGEIVHALRFIVSPAAFASAFEERVPPAPTITRLQAGSDGDGGKVKEIQILNRPRDFNTVYQIERDFVRSAPLSRADGPEQIKAALDPLADEDGFFTVRNAEQSKAWIYFEGAMVGEAQDLLTIHVPTAPAPDIWMILDLSHPEFFGLLRARDNVEVPLHIRILYRDEFDEDIIHTADWIQTVNAKRGLHWEGLVTSSGIDFLRPPTDSYVPVAVGATITGSQHAVIAFPTSLDVGASVFDIEHELDSEDGHHTVRVNSTPGAVLRHGVDYRIQFQSADEYRVTLLPGGHFGTPVVNLSDPTKFNITGGSPIAALGYLTSTYTTAGPRDALLAHTQAIATVDDLPEALADIQARLSAVEARISSGLARVPESTLSGVFASWKPDAVQIAYPLSSKRRALIDPWPARIKDLLALKSGTKPLIRPRVGSLLPAVHDAAAENLSALTPAFPALGNYVGRVFENNTGVTKVVPGRGGRATDYCLAGEHLACDGNAWYVVQKQESRTGPNPLPSTSEPPTTWAVDESTWYPRQFVHELFCFPVSASLLGLKRIFDFPFAFEAALFAANTKAQFVLEVRFGQRASATTPGTPGENLEEINWADPSLVQRIELSGQSVVHPFGIRVTRERDAESESGDKLTCVATAYGLEDVVAPPASAEFWIQGRLLNWDVLDAPAAPVGLFGLSGLTVPSGYSSAGITEGEFGTATVSR